MSLDINQVAATFVIRSTEEMIKTNIVQGGRRREAGNMPAQFTTPFTGTQNHCQGIPAGECPNTPFNFIIARHFRALIGLDGIDIGSGSVIGQMTA